MVVHLKKVNILATLLVGPEKAHHYFQIKYRTVEDFTKTMWLFQKRLLKFAVFSSKYCIYFTHTVHKYGLQNRKKKRNEHEIQPDKI
jgi:hypothetical protein